MFLSRCLDDNNTIFVNRHLLTNRSPSGAFRHRVVLGVGGNVGDMKRRIAHLWVYLGRLSRIRRNQGGVILKNPPFGYLDQDDFYNTVIEISTSLQPDELLRLLWRIEKRFGRVRSFTNAPRTLDLDMIFFDNRTINSARLKVPHPSWRDRQSVLVPLKSLHRNGQKNRR